MALGWRHGFGSHQHVEESNRIRQDPSERVSTVERQGSSLKDSQHLRERPRKRERGRKSELRSRSGFQQHKIGMRMFQKRGSPEHENKLKNM